MLRKMMIALVATTFMGAMAASTTADARMGGGGRGGGMHMGGGGMRGFSGGGMRGFSGGGMRSFSGGGMRSFSGGGMRSFSGGGFRTGFAGPRFRTAGFVGRPFIGPRHFAFRPGFARFDRFHHRRFAFAAVPLAVGVRVYGGSCWRWRPTPWGWQRVWVCGYDYGYY
jgi:hypothetical protein